MFSKNTLFFIFKNRKQKTIFLLLNMLFPFFVLENKKPF